MQITTEKKYGNFDINAVFADGSRRKIAGNIETGGEAWRYAKTIGDELARYAAFDEISKLEVFSTHYGVATMSVSLWLKRVAIKHRIE